MEKTRYSQLLSKPAVPPVLWVSQGTNGDPLVKCFIQPKPGKFTKTTATGPEWHLYTLPSPLGTWKDQELCQLEEWFLVIVTVFHGEGHLLNILQFSKEIHQYFSSWGGSSPARARQWKAGRDQKPRWGRVRPQHPAVIRWNCSLTISWGLMGERLLMMVVRSGTDIPLISQFLKIKQHLTLQ